MSFQNRVIAITGAASGIGQALAERLGTLGAKLALCDIDTAPFSVWEHHPDVFTQRVDVGDAAAVDDWYQNICERFGGCDILINNAGTSVLASFEQHELKDWERVLRVNLWGVVHGSRTFLPTLKERGGQIVNISSLFGIIGIPGQAAYVTSKYAVRGLSECLWEELQDEGVSVTVVHPGGVATSLVMKSASVSPTAQKHIATFFKNHTMPPSKAAEIIIRGIQSRKPRLVITREALLLDRIKRIFPVWGNRWAYQQIYKQMRMKKIEEHIKNRT
ncbi:MAG: SDR family NAD(P)-dependent oxidoreductase [Myxococcota bacterium]|nr:SDR family NAD(P)-dependent oxidoreductase [Myxococcota bacterium]